MCDKNIISVTGAPTKELNIHNSNKNPGQRIKMFLLTVFLLAGFSAKALSANPSPNIIYILADDLGKYPLIESITYEEVRFHSSFGI